jgi:hypothetical protein
MRGPEVSAPPSELRFVMRPRHTRHYDARVRRLDDLSAGNRRIRRAGNGSTGVEQGFLAAETRRNGDPPRLPDARRSGSRGGLVSGRANAAGPRGMRHRWLPPFVALSLASACRDRAEPSHATRPADLPAADDASQAAAPEAGQRAEVAASPPLRRAGPVACDADANDPRGCDYTTQACIHGRCVTCAKGTTPLITECAIECRTDRDCPRGLGCDFVAGDLYLCSPPAPKRKCPRGEVWLRSDGACWKVCKSDSDCPEYQCCQSDPNARGQICMGKCP